MKRWLISLFIGALIVVGCGSEQSPASADDTPLAEQGDPLASPLESRLGFSSEPGQRDFNLIDMQRQADATMVECMSEAGFFYAVGGAGSRVQSGGFVGDGSRPWVEVNGLGITRSLIDALAVDATSAGFVNADTANLEYVASLTSDQAAAYDVALVGDAVPDPAGQFEPAGCWGASYSRVVRILSVVDEFGDELMTLNDRLISDPRFLTFQQQWSACMDGAGFRYESERAMVDDVYARLLEVELVEIGDATQAGSQADLDELLQFELSVAIASFDCRAAFADEVQRLRIDYEQEFLDDNRFRLAELVESE